MTITEGIGAFKFVGVHTFYFLAESSASWLNNALSSVERFLGIITL